MAAWHCGDTGGSGGCAGRTQGSQHLRRERGTDTCPVNTRLIPHSFSNRHWPRMSVHPVANLDWRALPHPLGLGWRGGGRRASRYLSLSHACPHPFWAYAPAQECPTAAAEAASV